MNRRARYAALAPKPITADRTIWGIATRSERDDFKFPHFWCTDRRYVDRARGLFPPAIRELAEVVRLYVTVWAFARSRSRDPADSVGSEDEKSRSPQPSLKGRRG